MRSAQEMRGSEHRRQAEKGPTSWACLRPSAPPRPRRSEGKYAAKARAHEKDAPSPRARPRADQRFLLGRVHPPLAERAGPAGRRQSVLLLRPRLDLHRAQHGPLDPLLRDAQGDAGGGGGEDRLRRRAAEGVPLPHAGVHRLGSRHAGEAGSGPVRRPVRPAALFFAPATTRLPAWATVSSAIRRPGSRRSNRSGPISRSTAAWASVRSA